MSGESNAGGELRFTLATREWRQVRVIQHYVALQPFHLAEGLTAGSASELSKIIQVLRHAMLLK